MAQDAAYKCYANTNNAAALENWKRHCQCPLLQNQIIHDFGVKATLYVMLAYAIVAKNRGGV
jgi:hypothetical protein